MGKAKDFQTFRYGFNYYDRTGIQEFLEQKALEGWRLCKKGFADEWEFKRIEPKPLHYAITYLPQFSNEDSFLLSKERDEYIELCAESGWQFVCMYKNMAVFLSEEESPLPLETDPEVELASIHKSMLKSCMPKFLIALVISAAIIFGLIFTDISSKRYAFVSTVLLIYPLDTVCGFVSYLRWRKKALAAAATGKFSRSDTADSFVAAVAITVFIATVVFVIVKSVVNNVWETPLFFALFSAYLLFLHFIEKLENRYNSGFKGKIIKFVRIFGWLALLCLGSYIFDML